jgi:cold shock CspA family protein
MAESWNKKEREKKKQAAKREKLEKKQERKDNARNGNDLDSMMVYLDENGNFTSTPMDPRMRVKANLDDIVIGVPKKEVNGNDDGSSQGVVSFFNDAKGFGFIRDEATRQSLFVHINDLSEAINEGDKVTYDVAKGQKGPVAIRVKLVK